MGVSKVQVAPSASGDVIDNMLHGRPLKNDLEAAGFNVPTIYEVQEQQKSYFASIMRSALRGVVVGVANPHSFFIACLCVLSTFLASPGMLGIKMETFIKALTLGAVYPTINTIRQSYARRETALKWLSAYRAHLINIFTHVRDFNTNTYLKERLRLEVMHICENTDLFLQFQTIDRQHYLREVYRGFSNLSYLVFLAAAHEKSESRSTLKAMPQLVSRVNQSIQNVTGLFEMMRTIRDYRTPYGLRMFSSFVLHIMMVILGPYFNTFCWNDDEEKLPGTTQYGCAGSYLSSCAFAFVVLLLYHTQRELEDPFDGYGFDDIKTQLMESELGWEMLLGPDLQYQTYEEREEEGLGEKWTYGQHVRESGRVDRHKEPLSDRNFRSHGGTGWNFEFLHRDNEVAPQ